MPRKTTSTAFSIHEASNLPRPWAVPTAADLIGAPGPFGELAAAEVRRIGLALAPSASREVPRRRGPGDRRPRPLSSLSVPDDVDLADATAEPHRKRATEIAGRFSAAADVIDKAIDKARRIGHVPARWLTWPASAMTATEDVATLAAWLDEQATQADTLEAFALFTWRVCGPLARRHSVAYMNRAPWTAPHTTQRLRPTDRPSSAQTGYSTPPA